MTFRRPLGNKEAYYHAVALVKAPTPHSEKKPYVLCVLPLTPHLLRQLSMGAGASQGVWDLGRY